VPAAPAGSPAPPGAEPRGLEAPRRAARRFDWESVVGVKLFSWVAGVLLALAALLFLRFSVENGWLTAPIRLAIGLATGAGLLVACEMKAVRRYGVTANAMDAAGIVILFSTLFAAHALWHLLGGPATFALMVLVTVAAVALAVHHDSLFIALLGLLGGFATPALLASGEDRPVWLFTYLLLLNAGLGWLALRRGWPVLASLSLAGSTLYQWLWAGRSLTAGSLPLACGIFLAFPLVSFAVQALGRAGGERPESTGAHLGRTAATAATLPLVFAIYLSAVPAYGEHWALLFGFLFVVTAGLTVVAARVPRALFPAAVAIGALVFGLWLGTSYRDAAAWPGILAFVALFLLFYVAAPGVAARFGRPLGASGRHGAVLGCVLLGAFPVLLAIEPAAAAPWLPFGVLFALLAISAAGALVYELGALHYVAAFFAVAAEAVWSAKHLTHQRLLSGIALYAVFGLFYLGVPLLARRLGRRLAPRAGGAALLLLSLGLLFFLAAGPLAQAALWGLALLLVVLNAGLLVEAGRARMSLLALAGVLLSWMVIAVWWTAVPLAANLVPALFLVAGFAIFGLLGSVWRRRSDAEAGGVAGSVAGTAGGEGSFYLALIGHAFLLFVATQPSLAAPPWPLLGALGLLDLAIAVAVLWLRRAELWIAAVVASSAILVVWVNVGLAALPSGVAMGAAVALAALATFWILPARRIGARMAAAAGPGWPEAEGTAGTGGAITAGSEESAQAARAEGAAAAAGSPDMGLARARALVRGVAGAAAASLFLAQVVLFWATSSAAAPGLAITVLVEVGLLAGILALAFPVWWPRLAPASVATTTILAVCWPIAATGGGSGTAGSHHPWWTRLVLALAVYVPYLAFPPILGRRARTMRAPVLAAVLASCGFFVLALDALKAGRLDAWVGALPVAQAGVLALLLMWLRAGTGGSAGRPLEAEAAAAERDRGQLALVAGAVLAFVTAAIPLQLDREWITIGWALLAAALAWLYTRVPHRGLLAWIAGLTLATLLRLALNPAVLLYHPRGGPPIWNWFLYGYLVPALALLAAARILGRVDDRLAAWLPRLSALCGAVAVVLLFLLVNIEIGDACSPGAGIAFRPFSGQAGVAENLAYTLSWGVFAILLLVAGIALRQRATRIAAIVLLLVASLKGCLLDTSRLGGLYRVASLVGLAVCLALVAVLIQRFVLPARQEES
jgi:hypothetical protein